MNAALLLDASIIIHRIITRLVAIETRIPVARHTTATVAAVATVTAVVAIAAIRITVTAKSIVTAAAKVSIREIVVAEAIEIISAAVAAIAAIATTKLITAVRIELELILVVRKLVVAIEAGVWEVAIVTRVIAVETAVRVPLFWCL